MFHHRVKEGVFKCTLCPERCDIKVGERGRCLARSASPSGVILGAYGKITNLAVEPIEKKPIFHYKPNSRVLSLSSYGCNCECVWCQNFTVSQVDKFDKAKDYMPIDLVNLAKEKNANGICFFC